MASLRGTHGRKLKNLIFTDNPSVEIYRFQAVGEGVKPSTSPQQKDYDRDIVRWKGGTDEGWGSLAPD